MLACNNNIIIIETDNLRIKTRLYEKQSYFTIESSLHIFHILLEKTDVQS